MLTEGPDQHALGSVSSYCPGCLRQSMQLVRAVVSREEDRSTVRGLNLRCLNCRNVTPFTRDVDPAADD